MGNLQLLALLASQPGKAFDALGEKPRFWFPLLLALVTTVLMTFWFYRVVDIPWLLEESLRGNPRMAALDDAQRARAVQAMSGGVMVFMSVASVAVMVVLIRLAEATWFLLAGKVTGVSRSFRQWFSLASWTSLPTLLTYIPAAFVLATAGNGQIENGAMNPISLNELVFHRHIGDPGYSLLSSLGPLQLLAWWLSVVGVRRWSGRTTLFSAVYVLLPPAAIYGVWALVSLR